MKKFSILILILIGILILFALNTYENDKYCHGCNYPYHEFEKGNCLGLVGTVNETIEYENHNITWTGTRCGGIKIVTKSYAEG